jgi:hypothetical protein
MQSIKNLSHRHVFGIFLQVNTQMELRVWKLISAGSYFIFKEKKGVHGLLCVFSLAYHSKPILIYSFSDEKLMPRS